MKTVLIMSGGMDSTTLLYDLLDQGHDVIPVGIDYGQRHKKELLCAQDICARLNLVFRIVNITSLGKYLKGSSQTDDSVPVPHGHYAAESMKATVVPNRNMIMLAIAGGIAISEEADFLAYAAHAGDHTIYPDCRPEFATALAAALRLADWHRVELHTPYIGISKTDIARIGAKLGVPFERTWSCYEGGDEHCGKCGTCTERFEALQEAGVSI